MPDLETKLGQEVRKYRQILDSVKVPQITFGVLKNSNLSTRGLQIPAAMQKQFSKQKIGVFLYLNGLRHEKTCLRGFRPGKTQTGLGSHRS